MRRPVTASRTITRTSATKARRAMMKIVGMAERLPAEAPAPSRAGPAQVGLERAEGASVEREVAGLQRRDRQRDAALGDAGDLGRVDEAAAFGRLDPDSVEDVLA